VFALFSLKKSAESYPPVNELMRYLILFPAYKEDKVIVKSVNEFLKQTYPSERYTLVVISDQMQEETNDILRQMPICLLEVHFEQSTKARALNFAIKELDCDKFDAVIIVDGDNLVEPNFLEEVNKACVTVKTKAYQAHRVAKNTNTTVSVLDAVSEEINNSIFRKGFANAGFSATLSGSGMIFEMNWFKEHVAKLTSSGEDKELEVLLLKQKKSDKISGRYIYMMRRFKKQVLFISSVEDGWQHNMELYINLSKISRKH
jgi:cellulose synthase/poly-beta-1,6-N-acetylglucosamine synthase-like glycosyltransferase